MKHLNMQKTVTVLGTNRSAIVRYKDLEAELRNDVEIEVEFPRGMRKQRMKQLEELGYSLSGDWIFKPTVGDPIWAPYRGIFTRA